MICTWISKKGKTLGYCTNKVVNKPINPTPNTEIRKPTVIKTSPQIKKDEGKNKTKSKIPGLFGPILEKMSGLEELHYYITPDNRKYLLLGEIHLEGKCPNCREFYMNVDNFVNSLELSENNYLENKLGEGQMQSITFSRNYWSNRTDTRYYSLPYIIIHNWDLRQIYDTSGKSIDNMWLMVLPAEFLINSEKLKY